MTKNNKRLFFLSFIFKNFIKDLKKHMQALKQKLTREIKINLKENKTV